MPLDSPAVQAFIQSRPGLRNPLPLFDAGDGRRMEGPFFLEALLDHDAATNVDLTTEDAWYFDHAVRQAYSLTDGDTTRLPATLSIEAYEARLVSGTHADLDPTVLDNVLQHYLQVVAGQRTINLNLHDAWTQFIVPTAKTDTTATTGFIKPGGPVVLPSPILINLDQGANFKLIGDAAAAMGVDERVFIVIHGALFPDSDEVRTMPAGAPAGDVGVARQARVAHLQAMQRLAMIRGVG